MSFKFSLKVALETSIVLTSFFSVQRGQIEKNLIFLRIYVVRLCCVGVISSSHLRRRLLLLLLLKRTLQKEKKNRF